MTISIQQLITKEMAAEILSVSKRTIENWITEGTIPQPVQIGRRVYWHPENFENWLNEKFGYAPTTHKTKGQQRGRPRSTPKLCKCRTD